MPRSSAKPRTVAIDVDAVPQPQPRHWPWPWYVAAVAAPLAALLASWLLLAALAALGWLTSPETELGSALLLATRFLLLANGAPVDIGGLTVSLVPLGLSALIVFLALPMAALAARQSAGANADPDDTGRLWVHGEPIVLRVAGLFSGVYAAAVALLAAFVGSFSMQAVLGGLTVGAVAGLWGASRGIGFDPTTNWPRWLRAVPRAVGTALLILLAGGSALLVVALVAGREQVTAITTQLDGGAAGVVVLIAAHLAYLPNFILAAVSWLLGAGITLGDGSLLTPAGTDAGLLPALPILGVVPESGAGTPGQFLWLAVGVLAGGVAAAVVTLARPRARFDETALVGGLAGVLTGAFVVLACALGSGGLGVERLAHLGARIPELAVFAPTLLGLSGLVTGLVLGLLRPREVPGAAAEAQNA